MKIPITKIKDPDTTVPINSPMNTIERIKCEIASCKTGGDLCEVEVFDMWDGMNR